MFGHFLDTLRHAQYRFQVFCPRVMGNQRMIMKYLFVGRVRVMIHSVMPSMSLAVVCCAIVACTNVESSSIATDGVYAQFDIAADNTRRATVTAQLRVGQQSSLTSIRLTDGDVLKVRRGAELQTMVETQLLDAVWYQGSFENANSGDVFVVSFTRPDASAAGASTDASSAGKMRSAPNSTVTMPTQFSLTTVPTGSRSRTTPVVIGWDNPSGVDAMTWSATGSCILDQSGSISPNATNVSIALQAAPAVGGTTVNAGTNPSAARPDTCNVTVSVTRTRDGAIDPNFGKGGTIRAHWAQRVNFVSTP